MMSEFVDVSEEPVCVASLYPWWCAQVKSLIAFRRCPNDCVARTLTTFSSTVEELLSCESLIRSLCMCVITFDVPISLLSTVEKVE